MLVQGEINLIKNRKRISLGGHPQRVTEKNDLLKYDDVAPAAELATSPIKPEWDPRPIIHVEKSKTNLTPKTKSSLPVTPRFVNGVQNQLHLEGLFDAVSQFRIPRTNERLQKKVLC